MPQEMLNEMEAEFLGYDTFTLATGEVVELPMFLGKVVIKAQELETWFIPGDLLVGMEFLSTAGKVLTLNFEEAINSSNTLQKITSKPFGLLLQQEPLSDIRSRNNGNNQVNAIKEGLKWENIK